MILILSSILIVTVAMIFMAIFIVWLSNTSAKFAVTERFQDAEFILQHHQAPAAWVKPRSGFTWLMQRIEPIKWRELVPLAGQSKATIDTTKLRILRRLDELIAYFGISPFVQDEESRELLLKQLGAVRADWEQRALMEIVAQ